MKQTDDDLNTAYLSKCPQDKLDNTLVSLYAKITVKVVNTPSCLIHILVHVLTQCWKSIHKQYCIRLNFLCILCPLLKSNQNTKTAKKAKFKSILFHISSPNCKFNV